MSSNPAITIGVTAVDKASGVLRSLDQQVLGTTSKIDESSVKAANSTDKASQKIVKSYATIATSIAGLTAGIVGFATSFDTIEKAKTRASQAALVYEKSLAKLKDMQEKGNVTQEEYERQLEKVRINSELATQAQDSLSDTTANFYANIPAQMISFGTVAVSAFTAYTASSGVATTATNVLRAAMSFMAAHPVILVLMGLATLVALVATNTFGLRDAFVYAGKVIFEFLEMYLKPLADFVKWVIDGFNALGAGLSSNTVPAINETAEATAQLGYTVKETSKELENYQTWFVKTEQALIDTTNESYNYLQSQGLLNDVLSESTDRVNLLADYLHDLEHEKARQIEQNFKLVADEIGWRNALDMSNEALAKQAEALRKVGEAKEMAGESAFSSKDFSSLNHYSTIAGAGGVEKYLEKQSSRAVRIETEDIQKMLRRGVDPTSFANTQPAPNVFVTVNDMGSHYDIEVKSGGSSRRLRADKRSIAS